MGFLKENISSPAVSPGGWLPAKEIPALFSQTDIAFSVTMIPWNVLVFYLQFQLFDLSHLGAHLIGKTKFEV